MKNDRMNEPRGIERNRATLTTMDNMDGVLTTFSSQG